MSCGLRGGGDTAREPPGADPASEVEDTSTGESRSKSSGGDGEPEPDAAASTNFSVDGTWGFVS